MPSLSSGDLRAPLSHSSAPWRMLQRVERRVLQAARTEGSLKQGERVVVAVSGGPDSTALLFVLTSLQQELGLQLSVAHVDHGTRPEAERHADADFVRDLSARLSVPCAFQRVNPAGDSEDALRRARYAALCEVARRFKATAIALGHTLDDQAETVLMHLLRGAGLEGLAGMRPRGTWPFGAESSGARLPELARPLLSLRRAETVAYVSARGEASRTDSTNADPRYTRNRLRVGVLPALIAENPRAIEAIARGASSVREALDLVDELAEVARGMVVEEDPRHLLLLVGPLLALPLAVRHALTGRVLRVGRDDLELSADVLARIDDLLKGGTGRRVRLVDDVWARRTAAGIRIGPLAEGAVLPETALRAGATRVGPWEIEVGDSAVDPADEQSLDLPEAIVQAGLVVRSRRAGDRIRLAVGTRKVQDVLVDAKLPREDRDEVPLVCAKDGRVLWVVGYAAAIDAGDGGGALRRVVVRMVDQDATAGC